MLHMLDNNNIVISRSLNKRNHLLNIATSSLYADLNSRLLLAYPSPTLHVL